MNRLLVPLAGTGNDRFALQAVVKRFMNDTALEVHLLNVQLPFSADVARFAPRRDRNAYHAERAEKAFAPARALLERYAVPYATHAAVGDRAALIVATARRLGCSEILMATSRKNSLTRWVESSVTDRVLELTDVPVELIPGDAMSPWERYGIPAAITAAISAAVAALAMAPH